MYTDSKNEEGYVFIDSDGRTEKIDQNKLHGNLFVVGNKLMGRCENCGSIVRVDKPIIGSLHFCL
ncbi:MAG: hypothetical protein KKD18_03855 [Nanoarchaeota archaeon]|nr:hypothetical protein [Nanoarchaeota archaeon]